MFAVINDVGPDHSDRTAEKSLGAAIADTDATTYTRILGGNVLLKVLRLNHSFLKLKLAWSQER